MFFFIHTDIFCQFDVVILQRQTKNKVKSLLLTLKITRIMQLELNFSQTIDMQSTMKAFCENMYSIFISMQILTYTSK